MDGSIQVYYGEGRGKTTAALGLGIRAAGIGKQVIMEPELQIFRFAKAACAYSDMDEEERQEQLSNIRMALGYTRKVLDTGQCDLLILDEIFGLIDYNIITMDDLRELLAAKDESTDLILTGRNLPEEVRELADCIYYIHTEKEQAGEILSADR